MQAHTKKPHTETVALRLVGPARNRRKALASLRSLGFEAVAEERFISVAELFRKQPVRKNRAVYLREPAARTA